jgi:hypothetical protein
MKRANLCLEMVPWPMLLPAKPVEGMTYWNIRISRRGNMDERHVAYRNSPGLQSRKRGCCVVGRRGL